MGSVQHVTPKAKAPRSSCKGTAPHSACPLAAIALAQAASAMKVNRLHTVLNNEGHPKNPRSLRYSAGVETNDNELSAQQHNARSNLLHSWKCSRDACASSRKPGALRLVLPEAEARRAT